MYRTIDACQEQCLKIVLAQCSIFFRTHTRHCSPLQTSTHHDTRSYYLLHNNVWHMERIISILPHMV
ncbi:hypothetical protein HMPREF3190_00100 [Umbribacter vaginalis]|nr:hypothetical protein HMPREF3190_00100 [Coriobacteriales bacterium DNF00809]